MIAPLHCATPPMHVSRQRILATLLAAVLLLCGLAVDAAELRAQVDRDRLSLGETFALTLDSDASPLLERPDLEPLRRQFEIRDSRQLTRQEQQDGTLRLYSRLVITLQPRETGTLQIPPLQLGEARSQALSIEVSAAETPVRSGSLAPVFIDASLDRDSVYVQAQAILTLRVYHSVPLYDDSTLGPLQLADTQVEALGKPQTYEKQVDGVRHGVIETRYALYPQRSGELLIPPLPLSATALETTGEDQAPFGPRRGRPLRLESPALRLMVKPQPADYPAGAPWLPARALHLHEAWSPNGNRVQVGDSLTRHLLLRAEGLTSAQLPALGEVPVGIDLRGYPEQPRLDDRIGDDGVVGSREESIALVPSSAGDIELPGVELVWWSTTEDRLMHTRLPARRLQVRDNPALTVDSPVVQPLPQRGAQAPLWPWQLATALLALTTLLGFGLWWRARRQPAVIRAAATGPSPRTLQDDLRRACQGNDPHATRQALDAWARQQPETLADMAARYVPLSDALDGLNGALYSESGHSWQGDELWQAVDSLPVTRRDERSAAAPGSLPPLYPR